jgi:hypothetical protein
MSCVGRGLAKIANALVEVRVSTEMASVLDSSNSRRLLIPRRTGVWKNKMLMLDSAP